MLGLPLTMLDDTSSLSLLYPFTQEIGTGISSRPCVPSTVFLETLEEHGRWRQERL